MEKQLVAVLACLIFLVTVFLFEQVLPALGVTAFFLFVVFLLEREAPRWAKKTSNFAKNKLKAIFSKQTFNSSVLPTFFSMTVFFLLYLPVEFLITEVWLIAPRLNRFIGTGSLLAFVFVFNLIDWFKLLFSKKTGKIMFFLVLVIGILGYRLVRGEKLAREYLPKIYHVNPAQGIQGNIVRVEGVNFGLPHNRGSIFIGDEEESAIKFWSDNLVIFEQNVPGKFGKLDLRVLRKDKVMSNRWLFEVGNPDELRWPIEK